MLAEPGLQHVSQIERLGAQGIGIAWKARIVDQPDLKPGLLAARVDEIDWLNVDAKPDRKAIFAAHLFGLGEVARHVDVKPDRWFGLNQHAIYLALDAVCVNRIGMLGFIGVSTMP
mgnify:CR=1 FL=1